MRARPLDGGLLFLCVARQDCPQLLDALVDERDRDRQAVWLLALAIRQLAQRRVDRAKGGGRVQPERHDVGFLEHRNRRVRVLAKVAQDHWAEAAAWQGHAPRWQQHAVRVAVALEVVLERRVVGARRFMEHVVQALLVRLSAVRLDLTLDSRHALLHALPHGVRVDLHVVVDAEDGLLLLAEDHRARLSEKPLGAIIESKLGSQSYEAAQECVVVASGGDDGALDLMSRDDDPLAASDVPPGGDGEEEEHNADSDTDDGGVGRWKWRG